MFVAPAAAIGVIVVDPCAVDDGDVAISVDSDSPCAHTDRTRAKVTVRAIDDRRAFSLKEPGPGLRRYGNMSMSDQLRMSAG